MDTCLIQKAVLCTIVKLLEFDHYLLKNDLNERTISHKLACYLSDELSPDWHVDCEYNRNHDVVKRLKPNAENVAINDTSGKTVYPDIIVHKRDTDENLLVIEIKKNANREGRCEDLNKIKSFIGKLKYEYGLFIDFGTGCQARIKELAWSTKSHHNLPKIFSPDAQQPFIDFLNQIIAITSDDDYPTKQAKVKEYERQIDQMVYELYGLTPEETAVVKGLRSEKEGNAG